MILHWAPARIGETPAEVGYYTDWEEDDAGRETPVAYLQRVLLGSEPGQVEIDPDYLALDTLELLAQVCQRHLEANLAAQADEAAIDAYLRREAA